MKLLQCSNNLARVAQPVQLFIVMQPIGLLDASSSNASDAVPIYQLFGDDRAQDFIGPFADAHQHRVAVIALDIVFDRIAVAAENAHAFLRAVGTGFGTREFCHRGFQIAALTTVELARCLLDQPLRAFDLRHHVSQLHLHSLVLPDRFAERAALLRIPQ